LDEEDRKREKPVHGGHLHDLMASERYCTVGSLHLLQCRVETPKVVMMRHNRDFFKPSSPKSWDAY